MQEIKFAKTDYKNESLALYESINKQFIGKFPDPAPGNPRAAIETCDLHLDLKQPFMLVDPKGNPVSEIYWQEPIDLKMFWEKKYNKIWLLIGVCSFFMAVILYYGLVGLGVI